MLLLGALVILITRPGQAYSPIACRRCSSRWSKVLSSHEAGSSVPIPVGSQPLAFVEGESPTLDPVFSYSSSGEEGGLRPALASFWRRYQTNSSFLVPILLLILQNSGLILFMRYSIVKSSSKRYIISTAVLCSELIKFTMSSLLTFVKDVNCSFPRYFDLLVDECITKKREFLKIVLPSVLYAVQNNLQYIAVANLSAPVFQTMYQMKIVTAALFSVILLKRNLLIHQWASIFSLFVGASAVQLSQQSSSIGGNSCNLTGLITVVISCFTSGFSGVYFEKTLKSKDAKASIWLRNVQMSFFGILLGLLGCLTNDKMRILDKGFFYGYNSVVWTVILLQALGGLVVSLVVKHADNLMKGFATSLSIIISSGLSALLFNDLRVNRVFLLGSTAVVASTIAFGYTPAPKVISSTSGDTSSS